MSGMPEENMPELVIKFYSKKLGTKTGKLNPSIGKFIQVNVGS